MNKLNRICQGCGEQFKLNFSTQRYCSRSCWYTSPERLAISRETMTELWCNNPEFRTLITEVARKTMSKRWSNNPEFRALISEMARGQWRKHQYRGKMLEGPKIARSLIPRRK